MQIAETNYIRQQHSGLKLLRLDRQLGPGYMPMLGMSQLHGIGPWTNLKANNAEAGFPSAPPDELKEQLARNFRQRLQQASMVVDSGHMHGHIVIFIFTTFPKACQIIFHVRIGT